MEVDVCPDGSFLDRDGNCFRSLLNGITVLGFTDGLHNAQSPIAGTKRSGDLVEDLVGIGEVEETRLDKCLDGVFNELRFGFVFEGGIDLVDECLTGGWSVVGGTCEFCLDQGDAFFRGSERRNFSERCMTGDELSFSIEVADDGIEVSVLGDDVEIAFGVCGDDAAEFECKDEVQCVFADHWCLDNS